MKINSLLFKFSVVMFFVISGYSLQSQTVFISSKGKKYHTENCKILAADKKGISLEKAKTEGYKACRICKVKQLEAQKRKEKEEKKRKNADPNS